MAERVGEGKRIIDQCLNGHWSAWFAENPEVAFGGPIPGMAMHLSLNWATFLRLFLEAVALDLHRSGHDQHDANAGSRCGIPLPGQVNNGPTQKDPEAETDEYSAENLVPFHLNFLRDLEREAIDLGHREVDGSSYLAGLDLAAWLGGFVVRPDNDRRGGIHAQFNHDGVKFAVSGLQDTCSPRESYRRATTVGMIRQISFPKQTVNHVGLLSRLETNNRCRDAGVVMRGRRLLDEKHRSL
jgi:hypothetical protein